MSSSGVREKFTPIKEDFLGVIQWQLMMLKRHWRMSQFQEDDDALQRKSAERDRQSESELDARRESSSRALILGALW